MPLEPRSRLRLRLAHAPLVDAVAQRFDRLLDGVVALLFHPDFLKAQGLRVVRGAEQAKAIGVLLDSHVGYGLGLRGVVADDLELGIAGHQLDIHEGELLILGDAREVIGATGRLVAHGLVGVDPHHELDAALQVQAEVEVTLGRPARDLLFEQCRRCADRSEAGSTRTRARGSRGRSPPPGRSETFSTTSSRSWGHPGSSGAGCSHGAHLSSSPASRGSYRPACPPTALPRRRSGSLHDSANSGAGATARSAGSPGSRPFHPP